MFLSWRSFWIASSWSSNQSFCTLFFLPKTWAAAFWRTTLSSKTTVLQVDSLSSRNCSSNTFLSSSKRVSSFLGSLVPLFLFLMEKRHLDIRSLWSVKQFAARLTFVSVTYDFAALLDSTWSSWCQCFERRCCHVFFKLSFSWNTILSWNLVQNSKNMRPLELFFPTPCFPMTFGHDFQSEPIQALKSPKNDNAVHFGS